MKHLVLTLWFVLFLSSTGLAGVEYVTEEVCPALAGCWMDVKTGKCPDCVMERREVAHTHEHEEKPVVVKETSKVEIVVTKPPTITNKKVSVTKTSKKMCFFPEFGWLDLTTDKPLGEWRECDWASRGDRTAEATKRAEKECGGYFNWKWLDERHTKFVCSG